MTGGGDSSGIAELEVSPVAEEGESSPPSWLVAAASLREAGYDLAEEVAPKGESFLVALAVDPEGNLIELVEALSSTT